MGDSKMQARFKRLLREFAAAMGAMAMLGSRAPEEWNDIRRNAREARQRLLDHAENERERARRTRRPWGKDTFATQDWGAEADDKDKALLIALDRVEACLVATANLMTGVRRMVETGMEAKYGGGPIFYENPLVLAEGFDAPQAGHRRRHGRSRHRHHAQAVKEGGIRHRVADAEAQSQWEGVASCARNRAQAKVRHGSRGAASPAGKRPGAGGVQRRASKKPE